MSKEIDISSAKKLGIMGSLFLCLFFIPFLGVFAFFCWDVFDFDGFQ
jgi:hypothetical protein